MELFNIFIGSMLISNVILSNFLGICPFIGVSKKSSSAIGMGLAVVFVIILSSAITWAIDVYVLRANGLIYLRTIVFILVIATLVQFLEMFMKKYMVSLYKSLGVYLPLITTNCAVLGAALLNVEQDLNFLGTIANAAGISLGFAVVIFIFSTMRERLDLANVPRGFKGAPIALVMAALMGVAFVSFVGMGG